MTELAVANHSFSETDRFEYLQKLEETIQALQELGIPVKPASRLRIYEQEYQRAIHLTEENRAHSIPSIEHYLQGMQEIEELHFIVKTLRARADTRKKLEFLASGHDLPRNDTKSEARDYQYELLVAAVFANSGLEVVISDPDLQFHWEGKVFFVESKRPKSLRKFFAALRDGRRAIVNAHGEGIVALSLDNLVFGTDKMFRSPTGQMGPWLADRLIEEFLRRNGQRFANYVGSSAVFGLLLTLNQPAIYVAPAQFGTVRSFQFTNLCEMSDARYPVLTGLANLLRLP
jgi:hypothetical protein